MSLSDYSTSFCVLISDNQLPDQSKCSNNTSSAPSNSRSMSFIPIPSKKKALMIKPLAVLTFALLFSNSYFFISFTFAMHYACDLWMLYTYLPLLVDSLVVKFQFLIVSAQQVSINHSHNIIQYNAGYRADPTHRFLPLLYPSGIIYEKNLKYQDLQV